MQQPIIVYEDNHLLIVCKRAGELVQGDKTGDSSMIEQLKAYLKEKYSKPGNVFLGLVNRLDRPVAGLVVFAKTSKALGRMNTLFQKGEVQKTYLAIVCDRPPKHEERLVHYLTRHEQKNKTYVHSLQVAGSKRAELTYRFVASTERYHLLEVALHTGRHHQIRAQLSSIGCPIRGDLKYGAKRSNLDGSISLLSYRLSFVHPVSQEPISLHAPLPSDVLWYTLASKIQELGDI